MVKQLLLRIHTLKYISEDNFIEHQSVNKVAEIHFGTNNLCFIQELIKHLEYKYGMMIHSMMILLGQDHSIFLQSTIILIKE